MKGSIKLTGGVNDRGRYTTHITMASSSSTNLYFRNGLLYLYHEGEGEGERRMSGVSWTPAPPGFSPTDRGNCFNCEYVPYDPEHPTATHLEIEEFLAKLFPDPEVRLRVLTLLAACLDGSLRNENMYFLWGHGSNGKSTFLNLIHSTFGSHSLSIDSNILAKHVAHSDVIWLQKEAAGKRVVSMVDIERNHKINSVLFKSFLSETGVCLYHCNVAPTFTDGLENAVKRRISVIPFESRFVHHTVPVDPEKHVYHVDPTLRENVTVKWPAYFAGMLVWHYQAHYVPMGFLSCPKMDAAKEEFIAAATV